MPALPANPTPAQIINMSLGGTGPCSSMYATAVQDITAHGVLIVVSAGNEGAAVDSPANCAGALGVAGLRHIGTKVGYSNLGSEVGIAAPAGNCVNITPGSPCLFSLDTTTNDGLTTPGGSTYTNQFNSNRRHQLCLAPGRGRRGPDEGGQSRADAGTADRAHEGQRARISDHQRHRAGIAGLRQSLG